MKKRACLGNNGSSCESDPAAILKMLLETDAGHAGERIINEALLDLVKLGKVCIFKDEKGNVMIKVAKKGKGRKK